MPKLPRVTAKIFASNAQEDDIGQFGSALTGTKVTTSDISEIQALPAYEDGWRGAVISNRNYPTLQEMNGLQKSFSQQIAYCLQNGMPEWDAGTTYYAYQFCRINDEFYYSLTDENTGNNPKTDSTNWSLWAPGLGTFANQDLSNLTKTGEKHFINYSQTTNCIKQIPQNVELELVDGVIKLKAGSKLIVPYGTEDLSSTYPIGSTFLNSNFKVTGLQFIDNKFFVYVEVQNDISRDYSSSTSSGLILINIRGNSITGLGNSYSGVTYPSTGNGFFYDTSKNIVTYYNQGVEQNYIDSFPICTVTLPNTINYVFNGAGKIGSTIWIDKGIKGLAPDGLNEDGTLKNVEIETNYLTIRTYPDNTLPFAIAIKNNMTTSSDWVDVVHYYEQEVKPSSSFSYLWYNRITNKLYLKTDSFSDITGQAVVLLFCHRTDSIIDWFEVKTPLKINDNVFYDDLEIIDTRSSYPSIYAHSPSLDLTQTPSSSKYGARIISFDRNGEWYTTFQSYHSDEGISIAQIGARNIDTSGNAISKYFSCQLNKNGNFNLYADSKLMRYITDTYSSGTSWYRIYSDGWIEQGGRIQVTTKNNATVTFLKAFKNTNYTLSCISERYTSSNTSLTDDIAVTISAMSNSNVTLYPYDAGGDNYTTYVRWEAKGY